jgi:hypothetical protein
MSELSLLDCENEVERARAKLAHDLQVLRSPSTMSAFTDDIKRDALDVKSAAVDKAKSTAGTLAEEIKAKAAANPAATLMIGAGIAYRLFRNPPIATLLVGAGLFSLWRTQAEPAPPGAPSDYYVRQGRERLVQQASEAAEMARRKAAEAGEVMSQKAAELMSAAADRVETLGVSASDTLQRARTAAQDTAADAAEAASRGLRAAGDRVDQWRASAGETFEEVRASARKAAARTADGATRGLHDASDRIGDWGAGETLQRVRSAVPDDTRDVLLRGVANVALAAAVALMFRNRAGTRADG